MIAYRGIIKRDLPAQRRLSRALFSLALALSACSFSGTMANAEPVLAAPTDTIGQICTGTMHFSRGSTDFQACVESLQETVAELRKDDIDQQARGKCAKDGLSPGSKEFALCVLDRQNRTQVSPQIMGANQ